MCYHCYVGLMDNDMPDDWFSRILQTRCAVRLLIANLKSYLGNKRQLRNCIVYLRQYGNVSLVQAYPLHLPVLWVSKFVIVFRVAITDLAIWCYGFENHDTTSSFWLYSYSRKQNSALGIDHNKWKPEQMFDHQFCVSHIFLICQVFVFMNISNTLCGKFVNCKFDVFLGKKMQLCPTA